MTAARLDQMSVWMPDKGFNNRDGLGEGSWTIGKSRLGDNPDESAGNKRGQAKWLSLLDESLQPGPIISMSCLVFTVGINQDIDIKEGHLR